MATTWDQFNERVDYFPVYACGKIYPAKVRHHRNQGVISVAVIVPDSSAVLAGTIVHSAAEKITGRKLSWSQTRLSMTVTYQGQKGFYESTSVN